MSYVLGQYSYDTSQGGVNAFMTFVPHGLAGRKERHSDSGVSGSGGIKFNDECVYITDANREPIQGGFQKGVNYYFHGKIKRLSTTQTFDIRLEDKGSQSDGKTQFIKTIDILAGQNSDWVDVEFIFTPVANFDLMLFELRRIKEDYTESTTRYPIIIYQELSIINNILPGIGLKEPLLKIGVQSHPGLMMCINGEQIYIGKTGVYEIRNGIIKINSFSVVNAADEIENNLFDIQNHLARYGAKIGNYTSSICLFSADKTRTIDAFTLDYMYENGGNN